VTVSLIANDLYRWRLFDGSDVDTILGVFTYIEKLMI